MSKTLKKIMKSNYCKIIFVLFFVLSFYLIPRKIFVGWYTLLGIIFMLTFSLLMTCLVLGIKEKFKSAKSAGKNIFGIIAALLGLSALQVCTVGAAFCGVSLGSTIVAAIFPGVAFHFMGHYAVPIIIASILLQVFALYKMGCIVKLKK